MKDQRHLFKLNPDEHYFNCAYKSPLLKASEEAAIRDLKRQRNPAQVTADSFFDDVAIAKKLYAELVNCSASQIAIIPSTSYGLSNALKNIKGGKDKHALTVEHEFPSDYFSIEKWCSENEAALKIIKPDYTLSSKAADWNKRILEEINKNTAIVIMSSVHWMLGIQFDLKSIGKKCKEMGAIFVVDGTQSIGILPMDVQEYNIDALVNVSYKWLFGAYSLGFAYYSSYFNHGSPIEESWMNRTNARDFQNLTNYEQKYFPDAGRYSVGETSNFILLPIAIEGLKQIKTWGIQNMLNYCKKIGEPLIDYFKMNHIELEEEKYFSHHLFGIQLTAAFDMEKLKNILKENRITLSVRDSYIRISLNVFNTEEDVNALIRSLEESKK